MILIIPMILATRKILPWYQPSWQLHLSISDPDYNICKEHSLRTQHACYVQFACTLWTYSIQLLDALFGISSCLVVRFDYIVIQEFEEYLKVSSPDGLNRGSSNALTVSASRLMPMLQGIGKIQHSLDEVLQSRLESIEKSIVFMRSKVVNEVQECGQMMQLQLQSYSKSDSSVSHPNMQTNKLYKVCSHVWKHSVGTGSRIWCMSTHIFTVRHVPYITVPRILLFCAIAAIGIQFSLSISATNDCVKTINNLLAWR